MTIETFGSSSGTAPPPPTMHRLELIPWRTEPVPLREGIGAFRGLAFATALQLIFVGVVVAGCELWRLIR